MFDTIIERINSGLWQRVIAFFILWFAIYGAVWTIFEPLNFSFIGQKTCLWRWLFVGGTFLLTATIYFFFLFSKKLEIIGLEAGETNLSTTVKKTGNPTLTLQNDGFHGKLLSIVANYSTDPLNWNVKESANKANFITITYKPDIDLMFYARVNVLSKNKKSSTQKWLRFEPNISLPQSLNDDEEMGVPVTASDDNGLLRVNINLSKTIETAFGMHGWTYDKVLIIRARGSGKVKNIILR
jgi:hypothetical protein